jgi:hypothetical protein
VPYPLRGSRHCCWPQAGSLYPASHTHPTCFVASQGVVYARSALEARCFLDQQVPRSLQFRADGTLASHTLVASEALTGGSIANTLVGALNLRVEIVVVHNATNPGKILGTGAERAVGTCALVNAHEASVAVVELAGVMSRALVLAHTSLAVAARVPGDLSPRLIDVRRGRGGNICGLASGCAGGRHASRYARIASRQKIGGSVHFTQY